MRPVKTSTRPVTKGKPRRKEREVFGRIRPSGARFQASYIGPDSALHKADSTFSTLDDARAWLRVERLAIEAGRWVHPDNRREVERVETLASYAALWVDTRLTASGAPLKPRTADNYRTLLRLRILPTLGQYALSEITVPMVKKWNLAGRGTPATQAHAYSLLKTIFQTAVDEDLILKSPCRERGASSPGRRKTKTVPATLEEIAAIVENLPERYHVMIWLTLWCALRSGELLELRRSDIDLENSRLHVRRAIGWVGSEAIIDTPKTEAGVRTVPIPPHLIPALRSYLAGPYCQFGRDGLLFPNEDGSSMRYTRFWKTWDKARIAAGRPDLRFHDLRHTGATMAGESGATVKELMQLLGHTSERMAIRYTHATDEGMARLAARMSEMAARG